MAVGLAIDHERRVLDFAIGADSDDKCDRSMFADLFDDHSITESGVSFLCHEHDIGFLPQRGLGFSHALLDLRLKFFVGLNDLAFENAGFRRPPWEPPLP